MTSTGTIDTTTKRMLGTFAVTLAALAGAGGVWFAGAGTALAPEPVRLTQPLDGSSSSTAAGVYPNNYRTDVLNWPGSYTPSAPAPAGTPCSTTGLPSGAETAQVIIRAPTGTYGKCQ